MSDVLTDAISAGSGDDHNGRQHSGQLNRPIDAIRRAAATPRDAKTELEEYKIAIRKYHPQTHGLPWACQAHCVKCDQTVPAAFTYEVREDRVYLDFDCPTCGKRREHHHDAMFVKDLAPLRARIGSHQPERTHAGSVIRPVVRDLPKTVETLCPECACIILGRYYEKDGTVWIEKTCPDHGYFRDKINTDVKMWRRAQEGGFEDGQGVYEPQVTGASACPSDCGMCNQHTSTSVLPQIDMTNRCNLTCPICFANANVSGQVSEPTYDMIVEMLTSLRKLHPLPATSIQFTGGEPTLHPDFLRVVKKAGQMGFSHIQIATNGITLADAKFADAAAEAGLHTLYMQFDGVEDRFYKKTRGAELMDKKLATVENCKRTGMKICLVPTIIKGFNDDQVGEIFKFAVEHIEAISGIAYQPVCFTGRISHTEREAGRYTLGDLARDIAKVSGADPERDFWPVGLVAPLSRILSCLDGKPKISSTCHGDCAFGSYFFVTPEKKAIPIPQLFDTHALMADFNELAREIKAKHPIASTWEKLRVAGLFFKHYRWGRAFSAPVKPWTFARALLGLTNKQKGRGEGEKRSYKTLMAAGMHFMDRYNYDTDRVRRCVIQYSTADGFYPFCAINSGPEYRKLVEKMYAEPKEHWEARMEQRTAPSAPSCRDCGKGCH
jgi:uncharacterized radical SAM superfamily Fe-S cluster-containing enzyme